MKYIITESRLYNLVKKFLDSKLGDLKAVEKMENNNHQHHFLYSNKHGEPMIIVYPDRFSGDLVALNRNVYDSLSQIFNLEVTDDIQEPLTKYFEDELGFPVETVYTFNTYTED